MNVPSKLSAIKISFCTTCANRTGQLRQTFDGNAKVIAENPDVEWIIVNFNSKDNLDSFVATKLPGASNRIIYAKETSRRPWHASFAKNVAHRLGSGEILVNLDCDNFIDDAVDVVQVCFAQGFDLVHLWSGVLGDGTCGRIAIANKLFHALGGYDESFYPMGYQDFDLIRRATAAKAPIMRSPSAEGVALRNTKQDSIRHCARKGLSWEDFNLRNRARSIANVAANRLVANAPGGWAPMMVETFTGGAKSLTPEKVH